MDILKSDPVAGYIYEPLAKTFERGREYDVPFNINSLGLRDREYDLDAKGVFRVLLLGDSFSVGHGLTLENSLPKQLERALQTELEKENSNDGIIRVEVINAANGGYSPYNYWKGYIRWKPVFDPDIVLIGFFFGNDYKCEDEDIRFLIKDGQMLARYRKGETPRIPQKSVLFVIRKWLAQNSEFYVLMRNFFYYNETIGFFTRRQKASSGPQLEQLKPYLVPELEMEKKEAEKCLCYIRKLRDQAVRDRVPVVMLEIPVKFEIDRDYYKQIIQAYKLRPDQIDLNQPFKKLDDFCRPLGIPILDPRLALKKYHKDHRCYFQYDGHWNKRGVEIAAYSMVKQWKEYRLPPFN